MIILQTKRLASYHPETRAKRVFLLLPSARLPYRATRHHNKVTDPHVTSFTQPCCPVGPFDIQRGSSSWCQRDFSSSLLSSHGCKDLFSLRLRLHSSLSSTSQIRRKLKGMTLTSCPSQENLVPALSSPCHPLPPPPPGSRHDSEDSDSNSSTCSFEPFRAWQTQMTIQASRKGLY